MEQMTFDEYSEAKEYQAKMRAQGYKARIRPRSSKWQVVLRVKGDTTKLETTAPEGAATLSSAMGAPAQAAPASGMSGGSYRERLYRPAHVAQIEPTRPEHGGTEIAGAGDEYTKPETPASILSTPSDMRSTMIASRRLPSANYLRGKPPDVSKLTKMPYLRSRPQFGNGEGGAARQERIEVEEARIEYRED